MNYFINNTATRNNFNLALTNNQNIKLSNINEYLINEEKITGITKTINFESFIKNIYEYNSSYIPIIEDNNKIQEIV